MKNASLLIILGIAVALSWHNIPQHKIAQPQLMKSDTERSEQIIRFNEDSLFKEAIDHMRSVRAQFTPGNQPSP